MTWRERARDAAGALDDQYGQGKGHCTDCATEWFGYLVCHCAACHLTFTSVRGFDYHRIGPDGARRCRTTDELAAGGYEPNDDGQWRKPAPDDLYQRKE